MASVALAAPYLAAATASAEGTSTPLTAVVEVHIDNFAFTPAAVTVAPGTTVKWTNRDDIPHTVAAKDRALRSKPMDTNESFAHTFTTPGTIDYFCTLHPHMTGRVVVK